MKPNWMWMGTAAAALSLTAAGGARAGVTSESAGAYTGAGAYAAGGTKYKQSYGYDQDTTSTFPSAPLSADISETATAVSGGVTQATATQTEHAGVTLASATSGTLTTSGSAAVDVFTDGGSGQTNGNNYYNSQAYYYFTVTDNETMDISYSDLSSNSYTSNYGGYFQLYNETDGSVNVAEAFSNEAGSIFAALTPGQYYIYLYGNYNYYNDYLYQSGVGSQSASHTDTLSFNISAAPEPGTWALMAAGVGLAGAALRRRGVRAALAA